MLSKEELLYKAIKIADKAHRGQTDKYDAPYIAHPMRVMNMAKTLDEKIVAILHDVVEDCPDYSIDFLRKEGFSDEVLFAIQCLTKTDPNETYEDSISRIERSPLAISVKIYDLIDNMDLKRVNKPLVDKDLKRFNKYLKAYHYLCKKY